MKKYTFIFMMLLLFLTSAIQSVSAAADAPFKDVKLYTEEIAFLKDRNVIRGYGDEFRPEQPIKRIQAVQMILREMEIEPTYRFNIDFTDMIGDPYGLNEVSTAVDLGFISGKKDGTFDAFGNLTRAQMAKILVEAFDLKDKYTGTFSDIPSDHWAYEYINTLAAEGITTGYSDGSYKPNETLTRQHFAVFMARLFNDKFKQNPPSTPKIVSFRPIDTMVINTGELEENYNLPKTVEAKMSDAKVKEIPVDWDISEFDAMAGRDQTIVGKVEGTHKQPSVKIVSAPVEIKYYEDIHAITGVDVDKIELPSTFELTYQDGSKLVEEVTWDTEQLRWYLENDIIGHVYVEGTVPGTQIKPTVMVLLERVQKEVLQPIEVYVDTKLADLPLPPKMSYEKNDGTVVEREVEWDTSSLDLSKIGEQQITGTLAEDFLPTSITVIVKSVYPENISLSLSSSRLKEAATVQLRATITPVDVPKNGVTWTTSDAEVATVDETGKVTAVKEGTATITATTENGKTATTRITVDNSPQIQLGLSQSVMNGIIRSMGLTITNLDTNQSSQPLHVEKVEIYEGDRLYTSYSKEKLEEIGSTEILPGKQWGINITFNFGGPKRDDTYIIYYLNSYGKTYEYRRNM